MQEQDPDYRPLKPDFVSGVVAPMPGTVAPAQRTTADMATVGGTAGGGGGSWLTKLLKKLLPFAPSALPKGGGNPNNPSSPNDDFVGPIEPQSTESLLKRLLQDPELWKDAAGALGAIATGSGKERGDENQYQSDYNRSLVGRYGVEQDAALSALLQSGRDKMQGYGAQQIATTSALQNQSAENIARAKLGLDAPTARAQQSVRGSLMQNLQPSQVQGPAGQAGHEWTRTGGLTAAALDPLTRQHGGELMKDALNAQLTKSDVPAATDFTGGILKQPDPTDYTKAIVKPPELEKYQQPGGLESTTSAVATGADWLSDLLKDLKANRDKRSGQTTP